MGLSGNSPAAAVVAAGAAMARHPAGPAPGAAAVSVAEGHRCLSRSVGSSGGWSLVEAVMMRMDGWGGRVGPVDMMIGRAESSSRRPWLELLCKQEAGARMKGLLAAHPWGVKFCSERRRGLPLCVWDASLPFEQAFTRFTTQSSPLQPHSHASIDQILLVHRRRRPLRRHCQHQRLVSSLSYLADDEQQPPSSHR